MRRRHHDARGHRRIRKRHGAAAQGRNGTVGICRGHGHGILGCRAKRLRKGDVLVGKAQLKRLAGTTVRRGKHNVHVVVHQLAHYRDELGVRAGHVGLAHLELCRHRAAHPQNRREGQALLAAKVHLARAGVEPVCGHVRRGGRRRDVVHGSLAVVEERAGLGEHDQGVFRDVLDGAGRATVERREVLLERGLSRARLDCLEVGCHLGIVLRAVVEGLLRAGDGLVGEGHLATGHNVNGVQLANGLARGGHHAAHAVDLVAKELDAHRGRCLRGKDVDGVAMHVEGAGRCHVLGVAHVCVAHAHQQRRHVLKGQLITNGEGARGKVAGACWGHATQKRRRRSNHDALLARSKPGNRTATRANHGVIGGCLSPREIAAHGVASDNVLAKPGRERPRGAVRRLLARDNNQARARVTCPERRNHQRASALPHGERCVVARAQLVQKRHELRRGEQLARNPIDEHRGSSLGAAHHLAAGHPALPKDMQSGPHGRRAGSHVDCFSQRL